MCQAETVTACIKNSEKTALPGCPLLFFWVVGCLGRDYLEGFRPPCIPGSDFLDVLCQWFKVSTEYSAVSLALLHGSSENYDSGHLKTEDWLWVRGLRIACFGAAFKILTADNRWQLTAVLSRVDKRLKPDFCAALPSPFVNIFI